MERSGILQHRKRLTVMRVLRCDLDRVSQAAVGHSCIAGCTAPVTAPKAGGGQALQSWSPRVCCVERRAELPVIAALCSRTGTSPDRMLLPCSLWGSLKQRMLSAAAEGSLCVAQPAPDLAAVPGCLGLSLRNRGLCCPAQRRWAALSAAGTSQALRSLRGHRRAQLHAARALPHCQTLPVGDWLCTVV